jgi:hypothetical protein
MRGTTIAIAVSIFIVAALLIGLSIPLVQGKVPPNSTYGFRTSKTLAIIEKKKDKNKKHQELKKRK